MMMGVIMVMPMISAMPVMVMPAHQEQRAGDIDSEAQHRNQRGAREIDAHGIEEAEEGFVRAPAREAAEDQRRGEAGQIADLAGDRQSVALGKGVSVQTDIGGSRDIDKKKNNNSSHR